MEDASDIDDDADADQAYLTEIFLPSKFDYVDSDCPSNVSGVYKKRKNRMDVVVHQAKDKDAVLKKLKGIAFNRVTLNPYSTPSTDTPSTPIASLHPSHPQPPLHNAKAKLSPS
jgi:hypothetical protein